MALTSGYGLGLLQATPKEPDYVSDIIKNEMARKRQEDLEKQRSAIANRANEMHALGETQRLEKGVLPIHQQDILDAHSQFYKDVAPLKASRPYDYTYAPEYMNAEQKLNGTINEARLSSQMMRNDVLMNKKLPNQVYDASLSPRIAAIQNQDREAFLKANEGKNYYNGTALFDRKNIDEDILKELKPQDLTELPPIITYDKSGKMVTNQRKIYRPEVVKSKFGNYAQQNDAYLKAENNPNYQIDGKYSPQKFVDYHAGRVLPIDNYSLENPDHFYERQAAAKAKADAKAQSAQASSYIPETLSKAVSPANYNERETLQVNASGLKTNFGKGDVDIKPGSRVKNLPVINFGESIQTGERPTGTTVKVPSPDGTMVSVATSSPIYLSKMVNLGNGQRIAVYSDGRQKPIYDEAGFKTFAEQTIREIHKNNPTQANQLVEQFKHMVNHGTEQPSPQKAAKKSISRADIATRAAASGYTPEEYEKLLIKQGIEIK